MKMNIVPAPGFIFKTGFLCSMGLVGRARHIAYREPVYLLVTNGSLCFRHASLQSAYRTVARKGL